MFRMLWRIFTFALSCVLASRVQPQNHLGSSVNLHAKVTGQKTSSSSNVSATCRQGMHIKLDTALSDMHVVNPQSDPDEEQFFVLTRELAVGESQSGACSELARTRSLFAASDEFWDVDDCESLSFLRGSIEVGCDMDGKGNVFLKIRQFSCQELLPFSTIWEHDTESDPAEPEKAAPSTSKYEFAEFTCSNPLKAGINLLHAGPSNVLQVVAGLQEAQAACEANSQCDAIAIEQVESGKSDNENGKTGKSETKTKRKGKGGEAKSNTRRFYLLDSFNCMPVREAFHSTFAAGETVNLRYLAHSQQGLHRDSRGTVLESWSLEDAEVDVLVRFPQGDQYVLAEHLVKENEYAPSSWAVLRKIRERKAECDDLIEHRSCDILNRAMAEQLDAGTPASCHQACLEKTQANQHLSRCCVFNGNICALTRGLLFDVDKGEDDGEREPVREWAGSCYPEPCSLDPLCAFRKGELPGPGVSSASSDAETVFFDFAHPLTLPFFIDEAKGLIYHFASDDPKLEAVRRDNRRLLQPVGTIPVADRNKLKMKTFGKFRKSNKGAMAKFQQKMHETCKQFGRSIGRRLLAPNLEEALASDECELPRARHSLDACLVKAGCHARSKEDADHADWLPFSPTEFAQLPYDLLAWQAPAAFCCSTTYTSDERQEHMVKTLLEKAEVKGVNLDQVDDVSVRSNLKKSVKSGSSALKKMLMRHISDEAELNWLGQMVRLALGELKKILADLQETVDSESSDNVEIAEDGASILEVAEDGDQVTPSGRPGFVIARWSQEKGAFLQADPNSTRPPSRMQKAWNLISSVPGAVYQYGVRPLWNYVAKPLLKWGLSLMKWILEHPRAALFISKFGVLVKDRLCEKASLFMYGDPGVAAVGAFAKAMDSAKELDKYVRKTFSPAVVLEGLKDIMTSSPMMNTIAESGKFSFSLLLSWAGFATGGPVVALLGTMSSLLAQAGMEAGRRAMELMIYQEIAKEIPSNLFDMLTEKCLYKREARREATWNATQTELVGAGKEAISKVTETVQSAGKTLSDQMSRWSSFFSSVEK